MVHDPAELRARHSCWSVKDGEQFPEQTEHASKQAQTAHAAKQAAFAHHMGTMPGWLCVHRAGAAVLGSAVAGNQQLGEH
jgi:hypothetical protein